ncbi:MAG TPA: rRNA maturation RNase YbeY [Oligoflexus sp.]|uniref:rRNA maturation RNase YbeY n=1 Tax=Oligoflexus sp. TaxID=1971216 RepID=UPI002D7E26E7|nr:rRNA maturation RNase YbeY [Oligoflexus sp.]HET9241491.1 rRNA maturation RNase YbeY [Oligoflexus sp.]
MESDSGPSFIVETPLHTFQIQAETIERLTRAICAGLGLPDYEVSWDFIDQDEMRSLNQQYRDKDRSTDVLSFPQEEWDEPLHFTAPSWPLPDNADNEDEPPQMLGDVIISPEDALANAESIGHSLDRETAFLLVHGILHLCGHDHMEAEEEQRMIAEQQAIMAFLERAEQSPLWAGCCEVRG